MRSRLMAVFVMLAAVAPAIPSRADVDPDSVALAATSAAPWNPPRALPRREGWEQVVLLPGRIVSLPLTGLGMATEKGVRYLEDSGRIQYGGGLGGAKAPTPIGIQFPHFGDRAGIGGAVELRSPPRLRTLPRLSLRLGGSLHKYSATLAGISAGPVGIQYGYDWQPEQQFYGIGGASSRDSLADYGSQDEFVRALLRANWFADSSRSVRGLTFNAWGGPRSIVTRTGRSSNQVSYDERFPGLAAVTLDRRIEQLVYGGALDADWRAGRPHWGHGARLRVGVERYDTPIRGLALHTARADGAQFTRYTAETEAGVSFMRDPRTLRLLLRVADIDATSGRDAILFSDLSRLGGQDGLGGFALGRFRDMDLVLGRLMYVFPLARLFECEVHGEWGSVYPDVWRDASLSSLKSSAGFSLRVRSSTAPHGAVGVDFSREGAQIRYALGGVE